MRPLTDHQRTEAERWDRLIGGYSRKLYRTRPDLRPYIDDARSNAAMRLAIHPRPSPTIAWLWLQSEAQSLRRAELRRSVRESSYRPARSTESEPGPLTIAAESLPEPERTAVSVVAISGGSFSVLALAIGHTGRGSAQRVYRRGIQRLRTLLEAS